MELGGSQVGDTPRCFDMDMSTDFVPMSVFSDSIQGTYLNIFSFFSIITCVEFCFIWNDNIRLQQSTIQTN